MAILQTAGPRVPGTSFRALSGLLLCALAVLFGAVELTVRLGLPRISKIEGRIEREYRSALAIRRAAGSSPHVLVAGNSWLLHGVDFPALQKSLATRYSLSRYVVERTSYLDWYYGMRALYARGARPDAVVLLLNGTDMAVDDLRGDYFAYRMMLPGDVLRVSRDVGLPPTQTFSLLLASFSAFYGTRAETRKFVLTTAVPAVRTLRASFVPAPGRLREAGRAVNVVSHRLKKFEALVREHGGRFIFVEAPCRRPADEAWVSEASARTGVPVIVPMQADSLHDADFMDDNEHLNESGAARYTAALAPLLEKALESK